MRSAHIVAACLVASLGGGCVPMPRSQYVPVAASGDVVYAECVLNSHIPVGVRVPIGRAFAVLKLGEHEGRTYVELRLEVPPGTTLSLDGDLVEVETTGEPVRSQARFPSISLVDTPILNSHSMVGAVRDQQLWVGSRMVGGEVAAGSVRSHRHFWLAAYIEVARTQELKVTLPPVVEDGAAVHRLQVAFRAKTVVPVAVINC